MTFCGYFGRTFPQTCGKPRKFIILTFKTLKLTKKMAIYEAFTSTAIERIETGKNEVQITYTSDLNKQYGFNCADVDQFRDDLSSVLVDLELNRNPASVGRFVHESINKGALVAQ